jgi:hypothetical protein
MVAQGFSYSSIGRPLLDPAVGQTKRKNA